MNKSFAESAYNQIIFDKVAKKQALLYINFVNTDLLLQDYLNKQSKIDHIQLLGAKEVKWNDPNIGSEVYRHEKEHYKVYLKYGIESKLHYENGHFFVMDTNLDKTVSEKNYNKKKVIDILAEMLIAPYKSRNINELDSYKFDIPCYEILTGKIKQVNLEQFESALSQYE